jgi:PAS domain S-box-containing protein
MYSNRKIATKASFHLSHNIMLQQTFEHAPVGIMHVDIKGKIINANPELRKIVGNHLQWSSNTRFYELVYHKDFQMALDHFDGLLSGNLDKLELECRFIKDIADNIWVNLTANKIKSDHLEDYFLFVVRDISDVKKKEAELVAINSQLDNFVYRASHDLKSPLTSILGLTHLASHTHGYEEMKELCSIIKDTAEKMVKMLQQLEGSGKIKHSEKKVEQINVLQVLNEIKSQMSYQKDFSDYHLIYDIDSSLVFDSDRLLFHTVLFNIIENAYKYLRANESFPYCKINIEQKHDGINIIIEDNGQGIDYLHQNRLFDMFYKANVQSQGTGLGLFLVKMAVERLNGEIQMISTPNVGTTFYIYLPSERTKLN